MCLLELLAHINNVFLGLNESSAVLSLCCLQALGGLSQLSLQLPLNFKQSGFRFVELSLTRCAKGSQLCFDLQSGKTLIGKDYILIFW